jgi:hypothetical protein
MIETPVLSSSACCAMAATIRLATARIHPVPSNLFSFGW